MGKAIHITEAQLEQAIRQGRSERAATPFAASISYEAASRRYTLRMLAGGEVSFAADQVLEIADATPEQLADVELSPSGGALSWPQLDMDISVTGLVMDLIAGEGWRTGFRALLMREITGAKSEKKAAAARANGRLGGRPRKSKTVAESTPQTFATEAGTSSSPR